MGARNRHRNPNREDPPRKSSVHAPPGSPPTLAELSARNVAELLVWCGAWPQRCFHCGVVSLETLYPTQTIADVTPRLVCTKCGLIGGGNENIWITQVGDSDNAPYQIITINDAGPGK